MRARGANVTDIVVLVVAADDGVMPQTIEAINHSKAADVPIVVAINKCDLPEANPSMIKAELTKYEVISEDLGGDTPVVEVSALRGDGVDDLLETLALVAEIEELKANYNTNASGYIVESRMEVGRGNVATVIVTRGTLKQGDFLYAGQAFCRVKSMFDHNNKTVKSVEPGSPIDIIGWDESPTAGDQFVAVKNQKDAKAKAEENKTKLKEHDKNYTSDSNIFFSDHHLSHAASAFFPSPFKEAVVLTADGVGEWATTTVAVGKENKLEIKKEIHFPHSLGLLYSAFTYYTGFKVNSGEYKLMGLAPYGNPNYVKEILKIIDIKEDGTFRLDQSYFNYATGFTMTSSKFDNLFGQKPRDPKLENLNQFHMDIAASIQKITEDIMIKLAK